MTDLTVTNTPPYDRRQLTRFWTIIGGVLLTASVAQPLVSAQLAQIPPEELLAPMQAYMGDRPLPAEVTSLFAGVFANIENSLLFAPAKLIAGAAILWSVWQLSKGQDRARSVLIGAAGIGILAFLGIGLYFAYSSFVIGSAMQTPVFLTVMMSLFGAVVAYFPARWLRRNIVSLNALPAAS